jgi:anti-anti-sigma factor
MSSSTAGSLDIQMDGFTLKSEHAPAAIVATLKGNADMAVQEKFKAALDNIANVAKASRMREVVFDWNELYFMNSSCLSLLLRFINGVLELPASSRFKVRFRSSPNLKWQQKSLKALRSYADELVVIE